MISKITNGLLVSLLLTASIAGADSKYPATDFQPKIVYQDSDYKHSGSSNSASSKSTGASGKVSVADPDYPAANFEPEVLFQDENYKHSKGNVSSSRSSSSSSSSTSEVSEETAQADAQDSSLSLVIGLAILAVAGYVFYNKNNIKTAPGKRKKAVKRTAVKKAATVASSGGDAVSGVAKYLKSKVGSTPSGVEKYLEERESTPVSGVAKYVAKQKISARIASVTGVEKYLKDRG